MRVVVISVGRLRNPYVDDVAHYTRLLGRYLPVEQIEVRDGERVAARVPSGAHVVFLSAEGEQLDSLGFARFLAERQLAARDLAFVIGGARGLEMAAATQRLSLGAITLPHQLARVVLLEQLYRAQKINAGEPYHY